MQGVGLELACKCGHVWTCGLPIYVFDPRQAIKCPTCRKAAVEARAVDVQLRLAAPRKSRNARAAGAGR